MKNHGSRVRIAVLKRKGWFTFRVGFCGITFR